jgi:hypothetical protein
MFRKGNTYTRQDISAAVGGGVQDCISHSGGRVVAICMRPDMNPGAPHVLLVGKGPVKEHYGVILCTEQTNDAVPGFTRQSTNFWQFEGNFKVESGSDKPATIENHKRRSGPNDIQMAIHLVEV